MNHNISDESKSLSINHPKSTLMARLGACRVLEVIARISLLSALGWVFTAPVQAGVDVEQSPLIIQKAIPPNLVLMLDDSGSMGSNYMPDSASGVNSATNGVYYNPNTYYQPPKYADGTSYADAVFPNAYLDGFNTSSLRNIQTYSRGWAYYKRSSSTVGGNNSGNCGNNNKYNCVFRYDDPSTSVEKYVGETCAGFSANCHLASDPLTLLTPDGNTVTTTYGQNVANWFSYYQTRILMAKTSLTLAFSSLDPDIRVGFGSINGQGASWIKKYLPYATQNSKTIAEVEKFGDGTAGTQKANFWTWLIDKESASGGTPLRQSLQAVGKYYETLQPWQSTDTTGTHTYACRPAYTILTTDGFWNGSSPGVGNVDNNTQTKITSPSDYQYTPTAPFKDGDSNTLADVAMHYWAKDLRTDIDNEVPKSPSDPAYWQHMTTFTIGLGYDPTSLIQAKNGGKTITLPDIFDWAHTGTAPAGFSNSDTIWPTVSSGGISTIADLAHAAVDGHGNFFSANDPSGFVNGLKSALDTISAQPGANNAITQSSTKPTSADDYQIRGTYRTSVWTGTFTATRWDTATSSYVSAWDANSAFPSASNRNIWTVDKASTGVGSQSSVAFKLDASNNLPAISSAEKAGLNYYLGGVLQASVPQSTILNYLRGDKTYEKANGGKLRDRTTVLGDIVSSTPVYVAAPDKDLFNNASFPGASTYGAFVSAKANRTPLVYVAANDGMLHAFRVKQGLTGGGAADPAKPAGQEVYAYMPGAVLSQPANSAGGISNIANPEYGHADGVTGVQAVPHQYYNDGRITTQNVYMDTGDGNGLSWHTILVGTTGRGPAKSVYALDITDPSVLTDPAKSAKALLWERSAGDSGACTGTITTNCSNYIGEMVGAPVIAQIQQNGPTTATNPPQWTVFLGNGYNSPANKAALLQFNLKTGALNVHPVGVSGGPGNNGLAEPGLRQPDKNNGISTEAYAGDLFGNIWRFDIESANSVGQSTFVAKGPGGATQPITSLVALDYDKKTNSTWALFGTGKYLNSNDVTDTSVQTWYGLRVDVDVPTTTPPTPVPASTPVVSSATTRANLTQRTIDYQQAGTGGQYLRATSQQSSASDMNNKAGWYMDLTYDTSNVGERIVNRTQFIAGYAVVTTLIPKVSDPCNTVPAGAVMIVDPFTGANLAKDFGLGSYAVTVGGVTKDVPFNGVVLPAGPAAGVTGSYNADGSISLTLNTLDGGIENLGPLTLPGAQAGRVSWRELFN